MFSLPFPVCSPWIHQVGDAPKPVRLVGVGLAACAGRAEGLQEGRRGRQGEACFVPGFVVPGFHRTIGPRGDV